MNNYIYGDGGWAGGLEIIGEKEDFPQLNMYKETGNKKAVSSMMNFFKS